jgi:hypothetical protein
MAEGLAVQSGLMCGQCDARIRDGSIVTFRLINRSTTYTLKSENAERWKAAAEDCEIRSKGL